MCRPNESEAVVNRSVVRLKSHSHVRSLTNGQFRLPPKPPGATKASAPKPKASGQWAFPAFHFLPAKFGHADIDVDSFLVKYELEHRTFGAPENSFVNFSACK